MVFPGRFFTQAEELFSAFSGGRPFSFEAGFRGGEGADFVSLKPGQIGRASCREIV